MVQGKSTTLKWCRFICALRFKLGLAAFLFVGYFLFLYLNQKREDLWFGFLILAGLAGAGAALMGSHSNTQIIQLPTEEAMAATRTPGPSFLVALCQRGLECLFVNYLDPEKPVGLWPQLTLATIRTRALFIVVVAGSLGFILPYLCAEYDSVLTREQVIRAKGLEDLARGDGRVAQQPLESTLDSTKEGRNKLTLAWQAWRRVRQPIANWCDSAKDIAGCKEQLAEASEAFVLEPQAVAALGAISTSCDQIAELEQCRLELRRISSDRQNPIHDTLRKTQSQTLRQFMATENHRKEGSQRLLSFVGFQESVQPGLFPTALISLLFLLCLLAPPLPRPASASLWNMRALGLGFFLFACFRVGHLYRCLPSTQEFRYLYSYVHYDVGRCSALYNDLLLLGIFQLTSHICFRWLDFSEVQTKTLDAHWHSVRFKLLSEAFSHWKACSGALMPAFVYFTYIYWEAIFTSGDRRFWGSALALQVIWLGTWICISLPLIRAHRAWKEVLLETALTSKDRFLSLKELQPVGVWSLIGWTLAGLGGFVWPLLQAYLKN